MNNMMRKNNNRGGNNKHRGGARRYNNSGGGGGNRGQNDGQNLQRQKHHATQQLGKYNDLARNAQINSDRVDVEYYLQHVDHYTRVLADIAAIEAERFAQHREAHPAPASQDGNAPAGDTDASGDAAASGDQSGDTDANAEASGDQGQQRQHRQHRPRHQQPDGNGAREANSNTNEIPLPGSILPPI